MYTYIFVKSVRVIPVSAVLSRVPYECLHLQHAVRSAGTAALVGAVHLLFHTCSRGAFPIPAYPPRAPRRSRVCVRVAVLLRWCRGSRGGRPGHRTGQHGSQNGNGGAAAPGSAGDGRAGECGTTAVPCSWPQCQQPWKFSGGGTTRSCTDVGARVAHAPSTSRSHLQLR